MKTIKLLEPLIMNKVAYQVGEEVEVSDEVFTWLNEQYIAKRKSEVAKMLEVEATIESYVKEV